MATIKKAQNVFKVMFKKNVAEIKEVESILYNKAQLDTEICWKQNKYYIFDISTFLWGFIKWKWLKHVVMCC